MVKNYYMYRGNDSYEAMKWINGNGKFQDQTTPLTTKDFYAGGDSKKINKEIRFKFSKSKK